MSKTLWLKLYRDLTSTWGRTVMMTAAITVSLIAFGSMLFAYALEQSNATSGYLSTNPASARITLDNEIPPEDYDTVLQATKDTPGVLDASMRAVETVKLSLASDKTEPLVLYVTPADDPLKISKFDVEKGSWPPKRGEVLLERASMRSLGVRLGDNLEVIGFDGNKYLLKVSGQVHYQGLALAGTDGGVGYTTDETLASIGHETSLNQVAITVGENSPSLDRGKIVDVAQKVAENIEAVSGTNIAEVAVPPPGEHPHQGIADSVLTGLLVFGTLALVLSSILIATMFNALLTQQIPQIGILKTIGADTSRILTFYLSTAGLIAVSATLIALLPALTFGKLLAGFLLESAMNIDVAGLSVPLPVYLLYFASGLLIPLAVALIPLVRFARKTVREALDHSGGTTIRKSGRTKNSVSYLSKVAGVDKMLLMALRNMLRHRGRLALSLGLLATAGAIFMAGMNVKDGFNAIPGTAYDTNKWDAQVSLATAAPADKIESIARQVDGVETVETWYVTDTSLESPGKNTVTKTYPDEGHGKARLSAIPARPPLFKAPQMAEGRWLEASEIGAVVLPTSARQTLPDVKPGETITLPIEGQITTWRVVGLASELAGGSCPCVTQAGFEKATGITGGNNVRIGTSEHDRRSREDTAKAVAARLGQAGIKIIGAQPIDRLIESAEGHSDILVQLILLIAGSIAVVGLIGLNSMMSTGVVERTREFGVMKSIGASASSIMRLVIFEGIFMALISFMIAILPALVLTSAIGSGLGNMFFNSPIPFTVLWPTFVVWAAILTIGTTLATLAPAYRAAKITIREALAYL